MIALAEVFASLVAYLAVGACYARLSARRVKDKALARYRRVYPDWSETSVRDHAGNSFKTMIAWRFWLWPCGLFLDVVVLTLLQGGVKRVARWVLQPVTEDEARVTQLRQDFRAWVRKGRDVEGLAEIEEITQILDVLADGIRGRGSALTQSELMDHKELIYRQKVAAMRERRAV